MWFFLGGEAIGMVVSELGCAGFSCHSRDPEITAGLGGFRGKGAVPKQVTHLVSGCVNHSVFF